MTPQPPEDPSAPAIGRATHRATKTDMPELADQLDEALASLWSGNSAALEQLVDSCDGASPGLAPSRVGDALRDAVVHLGRTSRTDIPVIPGFQIESEL